MPTHQKCSSNNKRFVCVNVVGKTLKRTIKSNDTSIMSVI